MSANTTANVFIQSIDESHIESFHRCLDSVARERQFLIIVEAPALESTREFVLKNVAIGTPQLIALYNDEVIGWCDKFR